MQHRIAINPYNIRQLQYENIHLISNPRLVHHWYSSICFTISLNAIPPFYLVHMSASLNLGLLCAIVMVPLITIPSSNLNVLCAWAISTVFSQCQCSRAVRVDQNRVVLLLE